MFRVVISIGIIVVVTACASGPTQKELAQANYGVGILTDECIKIAKRFIASKMKDPGSSRFKSMTCRKGWASSVPIAGVPVTYGWFFDGLVNAKNSYGGYTGFTKTQGVVRDNGLGARVVRYCVVGITEKYKWCWPYIVN